MIINHNMMAMNTKRQMGINQGNSAKSVEKLSSGLRINRAGDDAAGLSISEKMRAQIRGLDQASRNAQDGISMIQTAEGALNETQAILQRMRELAVQSSNDTNVGVDRASIQDEIKQLKSEIDRIGETTEFNTQKLLRGDGTAAEEVGALELDQTGLVADAGELLSGGNITPAKEATLKLHLDDTNFAAATSMDNQEFTFKFGGESVTVKFDAVSSGDGTNGFEVLDGGNEVKITLVEDVTDQDFIMRKMQEGLEAAIAQKSTIDETNYTFSRDEDVVTIKTVATGEGQSVSVIGAGAYDVLEASTDGSSPSAAVVATAQEATGTAEVRDQAAVTLTAFSLSDIKDQILESGISLDNTDYFVDNAPGTLTFGGMEKFLIGKGITIGDETIEFFDGNDGAYEGDADFAVDLSAISFTGAPADTAAATATLLDDFVDGIVDQIGNSMENVTLTAASTADTDDAQIVITAKQPGIEGNSIKVLDGVDRPASDIIGSEFKASFQIGANEGQTMEISVTDMRSEALGIKDIDLATKEGAESAITTINDAIEKVSVQRSSLGAFQNRLEHSIKNLDTSAENLQSSESRIRDVDMAKEMMNFQKNNILQQAAQSMLAQANQAPQGVLQLLR